MADRERFNLNLENNDESFDLNPDQGDEDFIVDFGEVINTGAVTSYNELTNKPSINDVILQGNKTSEELGLADDSDITDLQEQIDAITVSSDVVDVLGTYQDLQNYDTSELGDNDIVKVLQDSTHGNAMSYYRWNKTAGQWVYVGSEGPFYTKSESDTKFQDKLVSGTNIKTINNESILGSGNIDIEGGYPEVPEKLYEYTNLLDLLNEPMYIDDGIYTVSQEWYCNIPKSNEEWASDYINPNSILYIYRDYGFISWTGPTSSMYWSNGDDTFTGGVLTTIDDVNYAIDEKLGSDVVMANTEQTISGKKTFTSNNGTVFQNAGGLIIKYLSSAPEFKIIPDNNGNFDFYYHDTLLGRIDAYNSILYRGIRPNLTETVDLGTSNYKFNNLYVKTLYGNNVPKEVSKIITNDNNILPETGGILTLGNAGYRWNSLYLGTILNFNPQATTKIENLKNLTVNTINLGGQIGTSPGWDSTKFLQYDTTSVKYKGKLYAGLDVNDQPVRGIPNTPDDGTSPINKNYADTNLQGKLTAGTGIAITNNVISSTLEGIDYEVDQELPATGEKGIIYIIPNGESEIENIYDEYIWIPPLQEGDTGRFEFIGTTQTDLSNYVDLDTAQTISGEKTITNAVPLKFAGIYTGQIINQENQLRFKYGGSDKLKISTANIASSAHVIPNSGNAYDLGTSTYKWRNVYVSGNISDGTNSVAVNKIANKDNFVTLSQSDYDDLVDGGTVDSDTYYFIEEE